LENRAAQSRVQKTGTFSKRPRAPRQQLETQAVNDTRPVNLDLNTIQLPITAITSILTRVSGVINFGSVAVMLWLLGLSLSGPEGFASAKELLAAPVAKAIIWGILSVSIYHSLAGIKHLFGDFGYGETLEGGVLGSRIIIVLSVILIALAGLWIW
jgi:succinate dehydrogenase / fumarate reductase cytochrome b subunit